MTEKTNKGASSQKVAIDTGAITTLAELLKKTDLTDIEYESHGCRIRVSRHISVVSHAAPVHAAPVHATPVVHAASGAAPERKDHMDIDNHPGLVKSLMVGTFYLSPKPGSPAFVEVGTVVKEGQTLGIIEAMKVMNPLKSPRSGKVTTILVEDAHPVEYDQPLFIIE
ncbi:MAG: acetyl-CoA carboxylase biotin carboxyl carrier protein [Alphaproteobacteria bacterium]